MHTMKTKRLPPEARSTQMLEAAIAQATEHGVYRVTREQVAAAAGVAPGLVTLRLGTMPNMRRTVMRNAVARGILSIVADGLAQRDAHALAAPEELRQKAAASLA